jgi:hypothetical protein
MLCLDLFGSNDIKIIENLIGYEDTGKVFNIPNEAFKQKYSLLTRNTKKYKNSFLSAGNNKINSIVLNNNFNNSMNVLYNNLYDLLSNRIINTKINNIDLNNKTITIDNNKIINYKLLINTIGLDIFNNLLKEKIFNSNIFNKKNKIFIVCELNNNTDRELSRKYSYIYSVSKLYTRKTYCNDKIIYELNDNIDISKMSKIDNNKIIDYIKLNIQILNSLCLNSIYNNVYFIGRYAQWNHSIKINQVIKRSIKLADEIR